MTVAIPVEIQKGSFTFIFNIKFFSTARTCCISTARQNTANAMVEEEITAILDGWSQHKALGRAEPKRSGKCRVGM